MSLRALAGTLDGALLEPGDAGYDAARTVWNAMVDRRPRAIARCASAADVAAAVRAGRAAGLELGVRCGGHGVLGLAVPEDGLMLDLTPLCEVRVDAAARRAWVGGGALLGALDRAAQAHGLATTAGNVSHTGVGGLTLGGGMGWLAREHGLTCDNVTAFELVTAEGEHVRADAEHNEELFWGLQGGGGNFGVVTGFEFRLHPVGTEALVVELYFTPDDAPAVLAGWRELSASAPRAATFTAWVGEAGAPFIPAGAARPPARERRLRLDRRPRRRPAAAAGAARARRSPSPSGSRRCRTCGSSGWTTRSRATPCAATGRATTSPSCRTRRSRRT